MKTIKTHRDLKVYRLAFEAGMEIFKMTKEFPKEETYSLTDQIRRSSRSVSGNIAEAFRKRRYPKAFISKLFTDISLFERFYPVKKIFMLNVFK